jgi:hypothetical protein
LWNAFGISAFDVSWHNGAITGVPKTSKFVRFDKYGIYGMDISEESVKDGMSWAPANSSEIDNYATFALTWEGLKITGSEGPNGKPVMVRLGKDETNILKIGEVNSNGKIDSPLMSFSNNGILNIGGWLVS